MEKLKKNFDFYEASHWRGRFFFFFGQLCHFYYCSIAMRHYGGVFLPILTKTNLQSGLFHDHDCKLVLYPRTRTPENKTAWPTLLLPPYRQTGRDMIKKRHIDIQASTDTIVVHCPFNTYCMIRVGSYQVYKGHLDGHKRCKHTSVCVRPDTKLIRVQVGDTIG